MCRHKNKIFNKQTVKRLDVTMCLEYVITHLFAYTILSKILSTALPL